MAEDPARIGYVYRFVQGKAALPQQTVPSTLTPAERAAWVRGWQTADQDRTAGRPSRIPLPPPPEPPKPVVKAPEPPAPSPEPPPTEEPEKPAVVAEAPTPELSREPRIVKAKVRAVEPPPAAPAVVLANSAPPIEPAPPWLLLRVYRDDTGFRIESVGSDAVLPGNGIDALAAALKLHVRLRLGPNEDEWKR